MTTASTATNVVACEVWKNDDRVTLRLGTQEREVEIIKLAMGHGEIFVLLRRAFESLIPELGEKTKPNLIGIAMGFPEFPINGMRVKMKVRLKRLASESLRPGEATASSEFECFIHACVAALNNAAFPTPRNGPPI